jgi:hypothetical protein
MFIRVNSLKEKLLEADVLHILRVEACLLQSYVSETIKGSKYCVRICRLAVKFNDVR